MRRNNGSRGSGGSSARGFAAMSNEEQRAIARKGGEAVSRNREHMAAIGRKGGEASAVSRSANGARRGGDSGGEGGRS
jgi:general stress protein YciG